VLRLLTDEQISPAVARQAPSRCRGISIVAMQSWEGGHFLSAADELVLQEAHQQKLTLVTFDRRTIPPLLRLWAEQGIDHSGVILVDEQTVAQNDIGGLVAALCAVWKAQGNMDWTNRVVYLRSPG
jgi:hypothetical protein